MVPDSSFQIYCIQTPKKRFMRAFFGGLKVTSDPNKEVSVSEIRTALSKAGFFGPLLGVLTTHLQEVEQIDLGTLKKRLERLDPRFNENASHATQKLVDEGVDQETDLYGGTEEWAALTSSDDEWQKYLTAMAPLDEDY